MPSLSAYLFTWISLTLCVGYLFTAAPAKHSHCSLPRTWGSSFQPRLCAMAAAATMRVKVNKICNNWDFNGFPWWFRGESICLQCRRPRFNPWVRKILWRRKWQPTPVLLPGKSQGRRSLVGYSPWGHKEVDMTERLHFSYPLKIIKFRKTKRIASLETPS